MGSSLFRIICLGLTLAGVGAGGAPRHPAEPQLPIKVPQSTGPVVQTPDQPEFAEVLRYRVRNVFSVGALHQAIRDGDAEGLALDLHGLEAYLKEDIPVDPDQIYGQAHIGPYPFEATETRYAYKRFRRSAWSPGTTAKTGPTREASWSAWI